MRRVWISTDWMDKGMGLIIENPAGYGADLDRILKFFKRFWIKVNSLKTRLIARSNHCYNIITRQLFEMQHPNSKKQNKIS